MSALSSIGRFAPSPTGPLHFGSLVSALASYLDIRQRGGRWLVRIEDIDPPREVPGASETILRQLDAHGLHWDGNVLYQSERLPSYLEALEQLKQKDLIYYCQCNRPRMQRLGGIYDSQCRYLQLAAKDNAIRLNVGDIVSAETGIGGATENQTGAAHLSFTDQIMGHYQQCLRAEVGDFVLRRRDGLFSYQLAVVVDDQYQGITHITRGSDLLDSTPRQIYLQQCLGYSQLEYAHLPVAINLNGQKLSKQNHAAALVPGNEAHNLFTALVWLQQEPPAALAKQSITEILDWGIKHWFLAKIPGTLGIAAPQEF
jgi:glutamyl-Q tRNA(Asp) synthetase